MTQCTRSLLNSASLTSPLGAALPNARIAAAECWPAEGTDYRALYLDAAAGKMTQSVPAAAASVTYDPFDEAAGACFDFTFDRAIDCKVRFRLEVIVRVSLAPF